MFKFEFRKLRKTSQENEQFKCPHTMNIQYKKCLTFVSKYENRVSYFHKSN